MAIHSKNLEETLLWKTYSSKVSPYSDRLKWIQMVFNSATNYLKDVRKTFRNYTLHDETHILNVIDAMGGLLGDQVDNLSIGELELLILVASMHDLGMVYTDEEIERHYNDELECREFLQKYSPDLLGCPASEWPEDTRQFFLRQLHPFRLHEILYTPQWRELFNQRPLDIVSERCIIAVCQAHGEEGRNLKNSRDLEYLEASTVDPLFCALMLRISDLLDFDDTRAPRILYSYVANNEQSRDEWKKHQASAGFTYRAIPSADPLPYKANCYNPGIERTVREFLDWVDEELDICTEQKRNCWLEWQRKFPFPVAVSRKEIESHNYTSGDFKMTMDQEQILGVLSGQNLYNNNAVFVRELLQNSIDATLLRCKMDHSFSLEKARIDFWEWTDQEGYIWFRIDDRGTGMTLGMLQRYFLKVGNSYYVSRELTRDLRTHGLETDYHGISRFGIGFLSCFLCGEYAEVSTLYFDPEKNRQESGKSEYFSPVRYGLRLEITGLSGYYTLKNQAENHIIDAPLPTPPLSKAKILTELENLEYRSEPGTSIAVRLNPKKLGAIDLHKVAETYLCVARFPVYYNGERIGKTYQEFIADIHHLEGKTLLEFSDQDKSSFDTCFPALAGRYPKISMTVFPLDQPKWNILQGLSGAIIKYDLQFDEPLQWQVKDQTYTIYYSFDVQDDELMLYLGPSNIKTIGSYRWDDLMDVYTSQALDALGQTFGTLSICPQNADEVGDAWKPFEGKESLPEIWRSWLDHCQPGMHLRIKNDSLSLINEIAGTNSLGGIIYAYNGVLHGAVARRFQYNGDAIFLLEDNLRPEMNITRNAIVSLPIQVIIAEAVLRYSSGLNSENDLSRMLDWLQPPLSTWRQIRTPEMCPWIHGLSKDFFKSIKRKLQEGKTLLGPKYALTILDNFHHDSADVLKTYYYAHLQDTHTMTVSYDDTHLQIISFFLNETPCNNSRYDLFPPLLFCKAEDDKSRKYLCCADYHYRHAITEDHPYAKWLLDHAFVLNQCFPRHFQKLIDCLCNEFSSSFIDKSNDIHEQLFLLSQRQGIDIGQIPKLTETDFWWPDWLIKAMGRDQQP